MVEVFCTNSFQRTVSCDKYFKYSREKDKYFWYFTNKISVFTITDRTNMCHFSQNLTLQYMIFFRHKYIYQLLLRKCVCVYVCCLLELIPLYNYVYFSFVYILTHSPVSCFVKGLELFKNWCYRNYCHSYYC